MLPLAVWVTPCFLDSWCHASWLTSIMLTMAVQVVFCLLRLVIQMEIYWSGFWFKFNLTRMMPSLDDVYVYFIYPDDKLISITISKFCLFETLKTGPYQNCISQICNISHIWAGWIIFLKLHRIQIIENKTGKRTYCHMLGPCWIGLVRTKNTIHLPFPAGHLLFTKFASFCLLFIFSSCSSTRSYKCRKRHIDRCLAKYWYLDVSNNKLL